LPGLGVACDVPLTLLPPLPPLHPILSPRPLLQPVLPIPDQTTHPTDTLLALDQAILQPVQPL
jgi:hypothetical protein